MRLSKMLNPFKLSLEMYESSHFLTLSLNLDIIKLS